MWETCGEGKGNREHQLDFYLLHLNVTQPELYKIAPVGMTEVDTAFLPNAVFCYILAELQRKSV